MKLKTQTNLPETPQMVLRNSWRRMKRWRKSREQMLLSENLKIND